MPYSNCCGAFSWDPELGRCPKCKENVEEDQWLEEGEREEEDNWMVKALYRAMEPIKTKDND